MTRDEQYRKEAEEKYPRPNINDCKSDLEYHALVAICGAERMAYIAARKASDAELQALREQNEKLVNALRDVITNYCPQFEQRKANIEYNHLIN